MPTKLISQQEWDRHCRQHQKALLKQHPQWRMERLMIEAYRMTEALHGPRPSGWKWLLLKFGWGLVRSGGDMDFSWTKNLWKAVRGALGVALAAAIYAALDVIMVSFDTPEELAALGAPQFAIPIILAILVSFRNWLKHKKRVNVP